MDYADKVFVFLSKTLSPGQRVLISSLTNDSDNLISTVKFLIDARYVSDIEFSNDYKYIRKQWELKLKSDQK